MNDRFAAELRQHLLETANERPGDGRLAAIAEGVAVTGQHHPLVSRLPWSPTRLDPFPTRAIRYGVLVVALIVALIGAALLAAGGFASRTVFTGTWTSIDPGDGSTQTLVVGTGASPSVRFQDQIATGGACNNDPSKVFTADGTGAVDGNHLDTSFPDGGGCGSVTVPVLLQFVYNDGTDSLRDQDGVDWIRVRADRPAVPSPTTSPSATPKLSDTCVQFDAATTYTAPAGSMSVSVDVPGTAQEPWLGEGDKFNLLRAACTDMAGQGYIEAREATRVYTDGCAGTSVEVGSTAEAIAAVAAAKDLGVVGQTDVTLAGYKGTRFEILVPEGLDSCPDHQIPVVDGLNPFDAGVTYALYLIDVDGKTLAVALYGYKDWAPAVTTAVDGILASMQIDPTPDAAPTPTPTEAEASPAPTPHPGEATFTSAINGFSIGVPKGWKIRAATVPWDGEPLDFDSLAADVIFDPATKDGLYLIVASQSFSDMSADDWQASVRHWTCPDNGHEFWSWHVDGIHSSQYGPCNTGSLVETDTRGYLIRLVAPRAEKLGLTDTWDTLKPMLETVDLRPEDAIDPPSAAAPVPACADIAAGATYTNRFGTPKLSATVPTAAKGPWNGLRDDFEVATTCPFRGPIRITAAVVDHVNNLDACAPWTGDEVAVTSAAEAADAIAAQQGHTTSKPTEVTVADKAAIRLGVSGKGSLCTDGITLWSDDPFYADQDQIIYLVDVGGKTVGIAVSYTRDEATPAQIAEAEAIVASIQIPT